MQNLIKGSSAANLINLDETTNRLTDAAKTTKISTPDFGENFNKIFQNATSKQGELSKNTAEQRVSKKQQTTNQSANLKSEREFSDTKTTGKTSKAKNSDVQAAQQSQTDTKTDAVSNNPSGNTDVIDELTEELKKLGALFEATNNSSTEQTQKNEDIAKLLEEFSQCVNNGEIIPKDLIQKIDDLISKLFAPAADDSGQIDDTVKTVCENIKNILNDAGKTGQIQQAQVLKSDTGIEGKVSLPLEQNQGAKLFVNEKNIQTLDGKIVANVKENEEVSAQKILEKAILDELDVEVEQVIVAPNNNQESALKNTTSAAEQVIKLSIEKVSPSFEGGSSNQNTQNGQNSGNQSFNISAAERTNNAQATQNAGQPKFSDTVKSDILNQIGAKLEQLKDGSNSKITLALRPHDLGRIVIELSQGKDGVTTSIMAQNQNVKEILEKNIEGLRQQLAQAGVSVQNIQVKSAESETQGQGSSGSFKDEQQDGGNKGNSNSDAGKNKQNFGQDANTEEEFDQNYNNYDRQGLIS